MSASALVTIFCDAPSCGVWRERGVAATAAAARRQLAGTGWVTNVPGEYPGDRRRDYCPKHADTETGGHDAE